MHTVLVIVILSAASAAALTVLCGHWWAILPLFVAACAGWSVLYWLVMLAFSLAVRKKHYRTPSRLYMWLLNTGYSFFCGVGRVKLSTKGLEKLPDEPFLLATNHLSRLDNMVQSLVLYPRPIAYVAKDSLFRVPIVGGIITRCCYLSLDRKNARKGMETISAAQDLIERGAASIGVFPEGHRGDGSRLGVFHAGCFKIAAKTGRPIVAACISGTEKVHLRFPWRSTRVRFEIIETIYPDGRKTSDISDEIQQKIQCRLDSIKAQKGE